MEGREIRSCKVARNHTFESILKIKGLQGSYLKQSLENIFLSQHPKEPQTPLSLVPKIILTPSNNSKKEAKELVRNSSAKICLLAKEFLLQSLS